MIVTRTTSNDLHFQQLVALLDAHLRKLDGDDHAFFAQFNKIDAIRNVVICYLDEEAIACGAFKEFDGKSVEIKRMYVKPAFRGKGIAGLVLRELELWTKELNYTKCVLETGEKQPEAIRLYQKSGYTRIPNYGQYANVASSVCMEKSIS